MNPESIQSTTPRSLQSLFETDGRDTYHNGHLRRVIYNGRNIQKKMIFLAKQGPVAVNDITKIDTSSYKVVRLVQSPSPELITAHVQLVM